MNDVKNSKTPLKCALLATVLLTSVACGSQSTDTSLALSDTQHLPVRSSPIPETTNSVPHIQLNVESPKFSAELLSRVSSIPGVDIGGTVISMPGAQGFTINENVTLANPQVIIGGREFAHVHPDGSLHASLPPAVAVKAVEAGWATPHPWSTQRDGWEGFVMLYTPTTAEELSVVFELVLDSYNFVTGKNIQSE